MDRPTSCLLGGMGGVCVCFDEGDEGRTMMNYGWLVVGLVLEFCFGGEWSDAGGGLYDSDGELDGKRTLCK